jgi:hypothetical protein
MFRVSFEPISNREDWIDQVEVRDSLTNNLVDLSTAIIMLSVRDKDTHDEVLLAQTGDGTIIIAGLGVFQFKFPVAQMHALFASKTYQVGCTVLINGVTQQFFAGSIAVIDGVVQ